MKNLVTHTCQLGRLGVLFTLVMVAISMVTTSHAKTIEEVIPADTFFYLKLQNLTTCRNAIETSQDWKEAAALIALSPKWQSVSEFLETVPTFFGTDAQGLIETFLADKIALTVSQGTEGLSIGLVIQNQGKTKDAEETLAKFTRTLASMQRSQVSMAEDLYLDIPYHTAHINDQQFSYGSIGDFFLLGSTPDSFKKMVDVYKAEKKDITTNATYLSVVETYRNSEVFTFVDVTRAAPYIKALLPGPISREMGAFRTLVYSWELLRPSSRQQLYGKLNPTRQNTVIPRLKTDATLQTTQGLSGTEEFFFVLPPSKASIPIWQKILSLDLPPHIHNFVFPPQGASDAALAGELTLALDLTNLGQHFLNLYTVDANLNSGGAKDFVKIDFSELNVGFIFAPDAPDKWQVVFNAFLKRMTVDSQQLDYKGITYTEVSIPGVLYYATHGDLFLLAFSQEQFQDIVDALLGGAGTDFQRRLAASETPPASCLLQLNFGALLDFFAPDYPWITPEVVTFARQMGGTLAALTVQEQDVWIEITHAPDRNGIDVVAKLAPFLFSKITKE